MLNSFKTNNIDKPSLKATIENQTPEEFNAIITSYRLNIAKLKLFEHIHYTLVSAANHLIIKLAVYLLKSKMHYKPKILDAITKAPLFIYAIKSALFLKYSFFEMSNYTDEFIKNLYEYRCCNENNNNNEECIGKIEDLDIICADV